MPKMSSQLASFLALLLVLSSLSLGAMPVYGVDAPVPPAMDDAATDVPLSVAAGMDAPEALNPETPRRPGTSDRLLWDIVDVATPLQPGSDLRAASVRVARRPGASPAPALHLRLCVFLC